MLFWAINEVFSATETNNGTPLHSPQLVLELSVPNLCSLVMCSLHEWVMWLYVELFVFCLEILLLSLTPTPSSCYEEREEVSLVCMFSYVLVRAPLLPQIKIESSFSSYRLKQVSLVSFVCWLKCSILVMTCVKRRKCWSSWMKLTLCRGWSIERKILFQVESSHIV